MYLNAQEASAIDGREVISFAALQAKIDAVGYRLDRSMDCRANAQYMTGPHAGTSYPCNSVYAVEKDTGIGWANIAARHDANREALKEIRQSFIAVNRSYVVEL